MMIQICTLLGTPFLKTVSDLEFPGCGGGWGSSGWGKTSYYFQFSFYKSFVPFSFSSQISSFCASLKKWDELHRWWEGSQEIGHTSPPDPLFLTEIKPWQVSAASSPVSSVVLGSQTQSAGKVPSLCWGRHLWSHKSGRPTFESLLLIAATYSFWVSMSLSVKWG